MLSVAVWGICWSVRTCSMCFCFGWSSAQSSLLFFGWWNKQSTLAPTSTVSCIWPFFVTKFLQMPGKHSLESLGCTCPTNIRSICIFLRLLCMHLSNQDNVLNNLFLFVAVGHKGFQHDGSVVRKNVDFTRCYACTARMLHPRGEKCCYMNIIRT